MIIQTKPFPLLCTLSLALILALAAPLTGAAPIGKPERAFHLATRGMKLPALLMEVGSNYDVPVIVSKSVDDVFIGTLRGQRLDQLLDELTRSYGLAWYFDGNVLYVYKATEVKGEVIAPHHLQATELVRYLRADGALESAYCNVRPVGRFNAIEVFGVPICVERVQRLSRQLDQKMQTQQQTEEAVQVFPLRYASAADTSYAYRGQQVTVPGLVSALRAMSRSRAFPGGSAMLPAVAASSTANGVAAPVGMVTGATGSMGTNAAAVQPGEEINNAGLPMISYDVRSNAVIIRDRRINMPLYGELIAQLDQRPMPVEISVSIIDIDASHVNDLGVDFGGAIGLGPARLGFNRNGGGSNGFSAVLGNTSDFFLKVNALEKISKAKVMSRPSIVTLNNIQAVLDHNVTFYTKLQGDNAVKLESVATGSLLRVTPRVINEGGVNDVMLTLDIQDGQQGAPINSTESLPQIKNSSMATQAVIKPGQSLLLGGFLMDKSIDNESKVPWFGDLPVIGRLFKSTSHEKHHVIRLFLIKAEPVTKDAT